MTEADKKAAEKFALESSSEPIPNFVIRIDEEDGANTSAYVLGRYRGYTAACAHKNAEYAELVEAAKKMLTIDEEYQADKADGPFDMVYKKWVNEEEKRKNHLKKALEKFEGAR